jgi:hypothetical protein
MTAKNWENAEMAAKGVFAGRLWLVVVGFAVGGLLGAADFVANGSAGRAVTDVAIITGYTALLALLRSRSETASVLAGSPVDERWQAINLRALAATGTIAAVVSIGGFAVAQATGHDWSGFFIVALAAGISYVGGVIWYRWRL